MIAATLSEGEAKWQGVVRLPERTDDGWGERVVRTEGIKRGEGVFRRMDIRFVIL